MSEEPTKKETCRCPYCDGELDKTDPLCAPCNIVFVACIHCGANVREGLGVCPTCGEKLA